MVDQNNTIICKCGCNTPFTPTRKGNTYLNTAHKKKHFQSIKLEADKLATQQRRENAPTINCAYRKCNASFQLNLLQIPLHEKGQPLYCQYRCRRSAAYDRALAAKGKLPREQRLSKAEVAAEQKRAKKAVKLAQSAILLEQRKEKNRIAAKVRAAARRLKEKAEKAEKLVNGNVKKKIEQHKPVNHPASRNPNFASNFQSTQMPRNTFVVPNTCYIYRRDSTGKPVKLNGGVELDKMNARLALIREVGERFNERKLREEFREMGLV